MTTTLPDVWFSSDHHFDHANIIKYCKRPFANVDEMNEEMIKRHNEKVKPGDVWYCLGDFAFSTETRFAHFLARLNGRKILITGNHDRHWVRRYVGKGMWDQIHSRVLEADIPSLSALPVTLAHFAHFSWNRSHHGAFHLHGHHHGGLPVDKTVRRMDVGVDANNFYPFSCDEILDRLGKIPVINFKKENL